jgi:hypothetical protein
MRSLRSKIINTVLIISVSAVFLSIYWWMLLLFSEVRY